MVDKKQFVKVILPLPIKGDGLLSGKGQHMFTHGQEDCSLKKYFASGGQWVVKDYIYKISSILFLLILLYYIILIVVIFI